MQAQIQCIKYLPRKFVINYANLHNSKGNKIFYSLIQCVCCSFLYTREESGINEVPFVGGQVIMFKS